MAYSHGRLAAHDAETGLRAAAEHSRVSILLAAGRDLRDTLRAADGALGSLPAHGDAEETRLLDHARSSVRPGLQLVEDLDELSRLHAGERSPTERSPLLAAEARSGQVEIRVTDGTDGGARGVERETPGRGVAADSLTLRISRDLTETMGGTLETVATGPGFAVRLTLPAAAPEQPVSDRRRVTPGRRP